MVFEVLSLEMLHRFFFFLGTIEGTLFKRFIELVIFTILSYMIISEYLRSKKYSFFLLMIAFIGLLLHRLIFVLMYTMLVFGSLSFVFLNRFIGNFNNTMELFTLLLMINGFSYPLYKYYKHRLPQKTRLRTKLILVFVFGGLMQIFWLIQLYNNPSANFEQFWGNLLFVLIEMAVLFHAIYCMTFIDKKYEIYIKNIYIAFSVYLVTPLLHFINIVAFANQSIRLRLLEHIFPFIAIILFTQVIYLKLVDKAYLKSRLERSQQKYREEQRLNELKDDFISTVSHELRTPITAIKLYIDLLLAKKFGRITKKQIRAFSIIKSESSRLANLINELLDLSKLEANKVELHQSSFDLNDLRSRVFYPMAVNKNLNVIFNIQEPFIVNVDIEKMKQIFINLMSNAAKFTDEGGSITVVARKNTSTWTLEIADTGKGMKEDEMMQLFDKFYQAEQHMTRRVGGSGLGLSIVKKLVELHQGTIMVESTKGVGSTFRLTFPL